MTNEQLDEGRGPYVTRMEEQLRSLSVALERLISRSRTSKGTAAAVLDKELEDLKAKEVSLKARMDELKHSPGASWKDLETGVDDALESLRASMEKAASRLR